MTTMIVMLKLKEGVHAADYERWAQEVDAPTSLSLASVDEWHLQRVIGLVGSNTKPPFDYIEVVQINSLEQLTQDVASVKVQQVSAELDSYTYGRVMLLTEQVI